MSADINHQISTDDKTSSTRETILGFITSERKTSKRRITTPDPTLGWEKTYEWGIDGWVIRFSFGHWTSAESAKRRRP